RLYALKILFFCHKPSLFLHSKKWFAGCIKLVCELQNISECFQIYVIKLFKTNTATTHAHFAKLVLVGLSNIDPILIHSTYVQTNVIFLVGNCHDWPIAFTPAF